MVGVCHEKGERWWTSAFKDYKLSSGQMGHFQQPIQAFQDARVTCVIRVTRETGQACLSTHLGTSTLG